MFGKGPRYSRAGAKERPEITSAPAAQHMGAVASDSDLEEAAAMARQLQEKESQLQQLSVALASEEDALLAAAQQQQPQQQQPLGLKQPLHEAQHDQPQDDVHWLLLTAGKDQLHGSGAVEGDSLLAARWRSLAARRAELMLRWQCLLEDKKQLSNVLQTRKVGDFEPGETPMRDVTCAVITHQMDVPCFSCCFQR